ncbi:MAG: YegS/Rv2252/BmrU family lipid kinase [Selenomonadaceae bacterium]|nr:YegS/Rv2252/BmrU family lipid kinase [Selenomonadaceae bacterium]
MKKILLVYNPVSGHAAFKNKLDSVIENFQRRGVLLSIYRTCAEDNSKFVECVKITQAEGIIAAGGDGTLHAVINWLKKNSIDLPVGVIGSGTSNDFAEHLNLTDEKIFDAVAEGKIRPVDLGLVNGKEYFINVASAGVFTSIAHEVNSRLKNFLGKSAYYLRGLGELKNFKTVPLEISADDKKFSVDAFLFLVLNSPSVAGFKKISDTARIDDGKSDLLALKKCSTSALINLAKKILAGDSVQSDENIFSVQAKTFEINSPVKLTSDLDGEVGDILPLKIETVKHAIKFFAQ